MEYLKPDSNNAKDLKLTTGTNICKVNNYSVGEMFVGLDDEAIGFIKRKQEKERLLRIHKELLKITRHAVNISNHGYSNIEASKPKMR